MTIVANLVFNRFPEIVAQLPQAAAQVVDETATDIEADAKVRVPVDTGALRDSIQTTAFTKTSKVVFTAQDYAHYVEYGTSRMASQPYMTPAAAAARPRFMAKMRNLEKLLK